MAEDTISAVITALGEGAVGIVRISGERALAVGERLFKAASGKALAAYAANTMVYGHVYDEDGSLVDEVLAVYMRGPRSYTAEDVVEIQCHGGLQSLKKILALTYAAGARPAEAGEFTKRAFLNGRIDLTQAEAVMDIISASGRQGAALGLAALDGALAKKIAGVQAALTELATHIAAWVDYPEEDVPALQESQLTDTLTRSRTVLDDLIRNYDAGAVLRRGVDAALLGRPNVGKSTLLNLLAGFERAIVTPVAGTTRDVVEQAVMLGGIRVNLFDTAGLRETEDVVEAEGIRRSYKKLEEAGLVLAVFDGSEPLNADDLQLAARCKGKPALALVNKNDLQQRLELEQLKPYFRKILCLSANDPAAREALGDAVRELLGVTGFDPGAACLAGERQLSAATRAQSALNEALEAAAGGFGLDAVSVCLDDALDALYALTGERADEAVIDGVFEKFCVGK